MDMTTKSCREFVTVLASNEPAPGGGGASALVAALGTALGNMVGSLTVGKKKYADVEEEIKALMKECDDLQTQLLGSGPRRRGGLCAACEGIRHPEGRSHESGDAGKGDHHCLPGSDAHHGAVLQVARRHQGLCRQGLPSRRFRRRLRRCDRKVRAAGGFSQRVHQHQDARTTARSPRK